MVFFTFLILGVCCSQMPYNLSTTTLLTYQEEKISSPIVYNRRIHGLLLSLLFVVAQFFLNPLPLEYIDTILILHHLAIVNMSFLQVW